MFSYPEVWIRCGEKVETRGKPGRNSKISNTDLGSAQNNILPGLQSPKAAKVSEEVIKTNVAWGLWAIVANSKAKKEYQNNSNNNAGGARSHRELIFQQPKIHCRCESANRG